VPAGRTSSEASLGDGAATRVGFFMPCQIKVPDFVWKRVRARVNPAYVVLKAAIGSRRRLPPKHLDIFKGAPQMLPTPLSDQFPVRVCLALGCLSKKEIVDASRGRTFHCKTANNLLTTVFFLA